MRQILYNAAINEAMHEEMERDETVYMIGEECSQCVWGTSAGLSEKFGAHRIRDSAISEAAIIGSSVGAALAGYRPISYMMFADFMMCGADELLYKAAKWRFAHGGKVKIPLVVRAPIGGYSGIGAEHSQCMESWVWRTPGLKIAIPSNPYDAKGLLKTAIRDDNPVVFLEHKNLMGMEGPVPEETYTVPFGKAEIKREGTDVTIVATGYLVSVTLQVANLLQKEKGVNVEVIDPRTLEPLDLDTILASVKKTKGAIIVDEDTMRCGPGAEIGMQIMENAFDYLDAPVKRVAAKNYPIAGAYLEQFVLPQPQDIANAVAEVTGDSEPLNVAGRVATKGVF
ncbi:MAG: alpha-ketoacid dehydrogenase subunit beta [Deltaproteobacteria bacterium]|nr:alpha-ketoacid dehydrogenase subunit beta [Deltaproteobacteria bacterium]